ncbi:hypothetical protein [Streptomyces scopuliridis]|uniref:hypothetical protein n=1 Tax=Streptomyces scopuliridis TaxID=452529 RepID=UPI00368D997B
MPELMVQIDGQNWPLTNCAWITWAPCGCPVGALTAAWGDEVFGTEEQALRYIFPTKRERERRVRQGYRVELMGWDRYRRDVDLTARCPHVKAKTTQQALDAAVAS